VHQLDNKVFDIIDAQCNHEDWKCVFIFNLPHFLIRCFRSRPL